MATPPPSRLRIDTPFAPSPENDRGSRAAVSANEHEQVVAPPVAACLAGTNDRLLKRELAAQTIGVSVSTFRRRYEHTELVPAMVGNIHHFRESEVLAIAIRRREQITEPVEVRPGGEVNEDRGKLAARIFAMLDDGLNPADVVRRLELDPDIVESLHARWARMRGLFIVTPTDVTAIQALKWSGYGNEPARSGAELVARLTELNAIFRVSAGPCSKCYGSRREVCLRCFRHEEVLIKERTRLAIEDRKVEKARHDSEGRKNAAKPDASPSGNIYGGGDLYARRGSSAAPQSEGRADTPLHRSPISSAAPPTARRPPAPSPASIPPAAPAPSSSAPPRKIVPSEWFDPNFKFDVEDSASPKKTVRPNDWFDPNFKSPDAEDE